VSGRAGHLLGRLVLAGAGAVLARAVLDAAQSAPGPRRERINYRGRTVSLSAAPALAVAASLSSAVGAAAEGRGRLAASSVVAGLGAGAVGLYDDVVGARPGQKAAKGFHGHIGALREGTLTSGMVKIVGVGAAGLAASALLPLRRRGPWTRALEVALGAGVIAGTANLINLFDLRPGRAVKAGLLVALPLTATAAGGAVAGPVGAAVAVLPDDLDERVMLGDGGANAFGALLGVALADRTGLVGRAALLAGLGALTAASERVSFTKVIEGTPGLRGLDRLGRRA
jgi:UDP-N-acetylmuramyl pentapeptide phosphotransferase/UDP-N-acetylglucosamine-1-phosphate transferase